MSIAVTKVGPYYSSGPISFSSLRSNFGEIDYGEVRISNYRRNTNGSEANPIVPDSTENENISSGNNLRIGGFRNSVKRYFATQSDIDDNSSNSNNPGLRMGRFDSSGKGIDWSGGGYSGRDGYGGSDPYNGNISKNIQKIIRITGTCGSTNTSRAGAQLTPATAENGGAVPVNNVTIFVEGSILGGGGATGQNGGDGLRIMGTSNCKVIMNGGIIYAGGGGGGNGLKGDQASDALCFYFSTYPAGSSCGSCPGCGTDIQDYCNAVSQCNCYAYCTGGGKKGGNEICVSICTDTVYDGGCRKVNYYNVPGGLGGDGGIGGQGQGYGQSRTGGTPGLPGLTSSCGADGTQYATTGQRGQNGGDGGDWGLPGGPPNGGSSGRAITGANYLIYGGNAYNIRGDFNKSPGDGINILD